MCVRVRVRGYSLTVHRTYDIALDKRPLLVSRPVCCDRANSDLTVPEVDRNAQRTALYLPRDRHVEELLL